MDIATIFTFLITYILSCYGSYIDHSGPNPSEHINPDKLHLLTYPEECHESKCEPTEYVSTKFSRFGSLAVYKIVEGSKCFEVRYDTEPIWKHDPDKNGDKFPFKVVLNTGAKVIWIIFDGMYYGYMQFSGKWKLNLVKYDPLEQKPKDEITPNNPLKHEDNIMNIELNPTSINKNQLESGSSEDLGDYFNKLETHILKKRTINGQLDQKKLELNQLVKGEKEIITRHIRSKGLGIWVGSWNLGGKGIELNNNFIEWTQIKDAKHEIYVFNFQEFVKLNFINIATSRTDEDRKQQFEHFVQKMLNTNNGEEYVKLRSISMTGLYMVIFAKKLLEPYIKEILVSNVKTGVYYRVGMNLWLVLRPFTHKNLVNIGLYIQLIYRYLSKYPLLIGNKGSVGIQFNLFEYNLSFLNLHLNFGQRLSLRRIELLEYVLKNSFRKYNKNVTESDFFVVAGDFNFSVLLEKRTILTLLKKMEYSRLLSYDEFNIAKINGTSVIDKLHESKIYFEPTYKYKGGTKYYTTRRPPAWCDRILFGGKLLESKMAQILSYRRSDNLIVSDHRPVSSAFIVKFD